MKLPLAGCLVALSLYAPALLNAAEPAPPTANISTSKMELTWQDGWLSHWADKETGETIDFGHPDLQPTKADLPYKPGPWFVQYEQPADLSSTGTVWRQNVQQVDDTSASITQSADRSAGNVHAVQWSVHLPYDQIDAVHVPAGLSPARLLGNNTSNDAFHPSYYFEGRMAMLAGHEWRHRYYLIQAKKGGLLIYMDDPDLAHHAALEAKEQKGEAILTMRAIATPPWTGHITGGRWVIQQYSGGVQNGAQLYQNYLVHAYKLTPLKDRPTAWAQKVGFTFVGMPWNFPLPYDNKPQTWDYGDHWQHSMAVHEQWLENLAKTIDPGKVMFYTTAWRQDGHDMRFGNHSVDPYFAHMVGKARQMGFHVMIHMHNGLVHDGTTFYDRYIVHQSKLRGEDLSKPDLLLGIGFDALRNMSVVQRNKEFGTAFADRMGLTRLMTGYHMDPAYEGWRYMKVADILSAVRATGADAVHLDVPSLWIDKRNDLYGGMNTAQGQREFYKLLRQTFDENGLKSVAIATELTPPESALPYTDFAQNSRDTSAENWLNNASADPLIELQLGGDLEKAEAQRRGQTPTTAPTKSAAKPATKKMPFNVAAARQAVTNFRELGTPSVDSLVIAPFVQGYPHLGATGAYAGNGFPKDPNYAQYNQIIQGLKIWYSLTHDVMPHYRLDLNAFLTDEQLAAAESTTAKSSKQTSASAHTRPFTDFHYIVFALARFWGDQEPRLTLPSEFADGDIARYHLKDGRTLRVFRSTPTTLRLAFLTGDTLADLDLFDGWKNESALRNAYAPQWLKCRVGEPAEPH